MKPEVVVVETKKRITSRTWIYTVGTILGVATTALLADANAKEILGGYVVILYLIDKAITLYLRDTTTTAIGDGKPKLNPIDAALEREMEDQGLI